MLLQEQRGTLQRLAQAALGRAKGSADSGVYSGIVGFTRTFYGFRRILGLGGRGGGLGEGEGGCI